MKKYIVYSFSDSGGKIGEKLFSASPLKDLVFEHRRQKNGNGGIKAFIEEDFRNADGIVFVSSTGIAVRMIKNFIGSKTSDPAVIVVDDTARFVIPILSGHLGGANAGAQIISEFLGSQCVITTASDNRNIEAVDNFAVRLNYTISSMQDAKKITALMVNGKKIGFYSEVLNRLKNSARESMSNSKNKDSLNSNENSRIIGYPQAEVLDSLETGKTFFGLKNIEGLLAVGADIDRKRIPEELPCAILIPRTLNLGIGLRKGIPKETVKEAAELALKNAGKKPEEISCLATIELKKNEKGLTEFAEELGVPLKIFSAEEIKKVENLFESSEFVKKITGVSNVSSSCAYLSGGKMILEKFKYNGVTVSVCEM